MLSAIRRRLVLPALLALGVLAVWSYTAFKSESLLDFPRDIAVSHYFIAHGGGKINDAIQTNSREAVERSMALGCRFIELDLLETSDGVLVASHDWQRLQRDTGFARPLPGTAPSWSDIRGRRILDRYELLSNHEIRQLLANNRQLYLVTDQTTNYALLNALDHSDRMFVETFGLIDYVWALFHGIRRPLLNVDAGKLGVLVPVISYFLANPKHVTVSAATERKYPWFIRMIAKDGVKLYIFTVNDPVAAQKYIREYGALIYTDDLLEGCS